MQSPFWARPRSEADVEQRFFQPLIDQEGSVLNRGLGALTTEARPFETETRSLWCSPAAYLLVVCAIVSFSSALAIELRFVNLLDQSFINDKASSRASGLSRLASIPLACAALNFIIGHVRRTTFWWNRHETGWCGFDRIAIWPAMLVTLGLLRSACVKLFNERPSDHIAFYIDIAIVLLWLGMYFALLDQVNAFVLGMGLEQEVINKAAPVKKMQNLVRNITRSGRNERDVVYCFPQTNTVPAEVLSYVWWVYYIVGKMLGAGIVLAIFMGVDRSLIERSLLGIAVFSGATLTGFVFELGPNALSLFRLSLNKPFYVGDLVTLNSNGAMDDQSTSIMGFVENITMMYIVVRNFEMKQTWIPHAVFSNYVVQNWTRRPSKTVLLNIGISCRCHVKKVEELTAFGKRWIQASPEIQQTNYQKCHITKVGNGYNIEVIFFPAIGVTHRGIRQKFLLAFMAAAERLQIPFVPLQLQHNFCDDKSTAPENASNLASDDATFEDLLPDPKDKLPKGVGLGFRQFPGSQTNLREFVGGFSRM